MKQKIILLTGASSGIGFETAQMLASQGHTVYGAARRVDSLNVLSTMGVIPLPMDLTDNASLESGVKTIIDKEGRIDILINNAGYGSFGPIEEVSLSEAKRQMDVNVFGPMRLIQLVLPYMRARKTGRIINTSSIAGRLTTYFGGWYHASKYALEALSDALRMELKEFGIDVILIEPGGIKTNWGIIAADHLKETVKDTPYQKSGDKIAANLIKLYSKVRFLSNPSVVAKTMVKAVNSSHPKKRYVVGFMSSTLIILRKWLPTRLFDALIMKIM